MSAWPGTLPQNIEEGGFVFSLTDNKIRSKVDVGPAKQRQRFTAIVQPFQAMVTLDQTQWGTLQTFHDTTLAGGTLVFTWIHPMTGAGCNMRFVTPPVASGNAPYVKVRLDLEIVP